MSLCLERTYPPELLQALEDGTTEYDEAVAILARRLSSPKHPRTPNT
ncbi:MAG TPA: hypothetical protein PK765_06695 [bacterium]|nr:hypothetical protein [bacterium]